MRDQFAPVIEGFDCDGITSPWLFRCEPFYEDGGNGGIMLDGTTVQDVLAVKNRFSWALNVLTMARYNALVSALDSGSEPDTVSAIVFDPATDTRYTTTFHVTPPVFRFVTDINGAMVAVADSVIVLEETGQVKITFPIVGNGYTLYDDGTLELDPPPEGSIEPEVDRWRRILDDPNTPIHDVDRIVLKPGVPSLPPGVLDQFPNLKEIVIPPDVEIDPDAFDDCPNLTIIKIVSFPRKSDYIVGDALDYAGLSVVKISGGTERDITPDCVLIPAEGYTTTEAGDIMVDVRYHDKSLGTFWVAVAEADFIASGDWWTLYDNGLLDIYCVGDMPDFYPSWNHISTANYVPWANYKTQVTNVIIRNSVTRIGDSAFEHCSNLTSVTIPNSVISIGKYAFAYTSIVSITIPDSVTSIERGAFEDCKSLTSIVIPDGVTYISDNVFAECNNLTSITIPDGVTRIEYRAFVNCHSLTSITIPRNVRTIGVEAFQNCHSLTSVTIPSSVITIDNCAFENCDALSSVTIENGVTSIGTRLTYAWSIGSVFAGCTSLISVTIPRSVGSILCGTFFGCINLTSIQVDSESPYFCDVDGVLFNKSKTTLIEYPGGKTGSSYQIPDSVTIIDRYAFYQCGSLTSVTIPSSVTRIDYDAFAQCNALADVYYSGTEAQWNAIIMVGANTPLRNATIHYNSSPT